MVWVRIWWWAVVVVRGRVSVDERWDCGKGVIVWGGGGEGVGVRLYGL